MQTGHGNPGRAVAGWSWRGCPSHATGLNARGARRGFTLAELMVAVAVLLILLTMVGWIFSTATRASSTAMASNELMGVGRAAEGKLLQDFNGLLKSGFVGIWYQLTLDPRYPAANPPRYLRTDRMVFYTVGDHSTIRQMRLPTDPSTWTSAQIVPLNSSITNTSTFQPLHGSRAKVFLGHYAATDQSLTKPNTDPETWMLARRERIISPDLDTTNNVVNAALATYASSAAYADNCEFEFQTPEALSMKCQQLGNVAALNQLVGAWLSDNPAGPYLWMDASTTPNKAWCSGWMRRPQIDPAAAYNSGTHVLFVPGCAEFKIQRWLERNPWTGAPLGPGQARWWPEEDLDGNGVPNEANVDGFDHSDFVQAGAGVIVPPNPTNIREYYNGPVPPVPPSAGNWGGWSPYYPNTNAPPGPGAWFYRTQQDMPKAIKVTMRLFDPNKRIAGGQVFTMTFGLSGDQP